MPEIISPIPMELQQDYKERLKKYPFYDNGLVEKQSAEQYYNVNRLGLIIDLSHGQMKEHMTTNKPLYTPIAFMFNLVLEELLTRNPNEEYTCTQNMQLVGRDPTLDSYNKDVAIPTMERFIWGLDFLTEVPPLMPGKVEYVITASNGLVDRYSGMHSVTISSSSPIYNDGTTKSEFVQFLHNSIDSCDTFFIKSDTLFYFLIESLRVFGYGSLRLKKCSLCGRYFIEESFNEKYCKFGNLQYEGKLCSDVAHYLQNLQNLSKREFAKLEKQIYERLAKRANAKGRSSDDYQLFMKFADEKKKKKYDLANSHISKNEYELWLQEWDNKSRKRPKKQRKD